MSSNVPSHTAIFNAALSGHVDHCFFCCHRGENIFESLSPLWAFFVDCMQKQHVLLVLFLLFIEILAGTWYAISYIPFGRKIVVAFLRRTICKPCFQVYDDLRGQHGSTSGSGGVMSMKGFSALQEEAWSDLINYVLNWIPVYLSQLWMVFLISTNKYRYSLYSSGFKHSDWIVVPHLDLCMYQKLCPNTCKKWIYMNTITVGKTQLT